jgi:hypothetical protein
MFYKNYDSLTLGPLLTPIQFHSERKCPRTENIPKISMLKVEHFQLQQFFRRKICVGQTENISENTIVKSWNWFSTSTFFRRKICVGQAENFPRISLLKVETDFQLQHFCRPITFYKIFEKFVKGHPDEVPFARNVKFSLVFFSFLVSLAPPTLATPFKINKVSLGFLL